VKIVVLDGYTENPGDLSWENLEKLGELIVYERTPKDKTAARIGDAEIVMTNKTLIDEKIMDACPDMKYVGVLATGYNVVDLSAASKRGIVVTNIPAYSTAATAQMAMALLLEICHHTGHHSDAVFAGRWTSSADFCFWDYPLIELDGKTMGIIGYGKIGRLTGRIARAFGMKVIACRSSANAEESADFDTVLRESDVIALHCPLSPATEGIINKSSIAKMKDGVIIINNSRGPLIVEQDLCDALNSGKVYAAGVDVVSVEPIEADNPLLKAKNCFITPHISWASKECRQRLMDIAVDNLKNFIRGTPTNAVNP
jgi:glycerate dehydrogenase